MTTVGVNPYLVCRVDALRFPSYNYRHPAFKQRQLEAERERLLASPVPVFRRTSADHILRDKFNREASNLACPDGSKRKTKFEVPPIPAQKANDLLRSNLTPREYSRWRHDTTPVVTTATRMEWNRFLDRCPERYDIALPRDTDTCKIRYDDGFAVRYLDPFRTRGVGMERVQGPFFGYIQGPADMSPYRTIIQTHPIE